MKRLLKWIKNLFKKDDVKVIRHNNKITFKIPVETLSKEQVDKCVSELISHYNEEIDWDDNRGEVKINGSKHLPYTKQIWFPSPDYNGENPQFETDVDIYEGLRYFVHKSDLSNASKEFILSLIKVCEDTYGDNILENPEINFYEILKLINDVYPIFDEKYLKEKIKK